MSSLRELQTRFVGLLFGEGPDLDAPWIRTTEGAEGPHDAVEARLRLGIYRNNLHEGFIRALGLEFPVIERLVGGDYFRQLAKEFLAVQPSRAGDLHEVGAPFPHYLRSRYGHTEYAYLPDVAELEWAYQQAAVAAEAPGFDPAALAGVAAEDYGRLRFGLKPACLLVRSEFPILRIWQTNQSGSDEETIELGSGAEHVVTRRVREGVELHRIPAALHSLLDAFSHGRALAQAWLEAQQIDPDFDLGAALRQCISLGLLTMPQPETTSPKEGIPS